MYKLTAPGGYFRNNRLVFGLIWEGSVFSSFFETSVWRMAYLVLVYSSRFVLVSLGKEGCGAFCLLGVGGGYYYSVFIMVLE